MAELKRLATKIQAEVEYKKRIKALEKDVKDRDSMILGLTNENKVLEGKLDKWVKMQENGYTAVTINDGMITNAVTILPFSTFVYTQDIPKHILAPLYKNYPFYQLDQNGKIIQNPQKYNRYIGGYTL